MDMPKTETLPPTVPNRTRTRKNEGKTLNAAETGLRDELRSIVSYSQLW